MKKNFGLFLVALALLMGAQLYAQTESFSFAQVDEKPMFQGAEAGKFATTWVFKQIKYPEEAYKNNIQGRTALQFVIAKDGKVKNVRVLRSSGSELLDNEAVRVISSSPDWTPGKVKGKPVDVIYTFPVVFKLNGEAKTDAMPFSEVEQKPTFMGKEPDAEFIKWMFSNVQYPAEAKTKGIQGRVALQFTIAKDGKVKDVKVVRSSGSEILDNEALRVLSMSPNWEPGKHKGEAVNVSFTFPFVFKIN